MLTKLNMSCLKNSTWWSCREQINHRVWEEVWVEVLEAIRMQSFRGSILQTIIAQEGLNAD